MERVRRTTNTDWSAISILAHEIGHHLQGHTLLRGGSRPEIELQADRYSGYVLQRMGASLDEAQIAMRNLGSQSGSATHPGRDARLAAIANGWVAARDQSRNRTSDPDPKPEPESTNTSTRTRPRPEPEPEPEPEPVRSRGLPSGSVVAGCGCWGPSMGGVINEPRCDSGRAVLQACVGVCYPLGGSPYGAVCQ
jgi:hypothetical protein